jgi:heme/copper-type cytochrome/quinol oxidase subunit 2
MAEICGIGHGVMGARPVIQSAEAHQQWLEAGLKPLNTSGWSSNGLSLCRLTWDLANALR